ncbi:MAG: hypothetical protein RJR34_08235 [Candidatus Methanoculleus thermohydrogenotrophicum]|nr:hypothetical protein [Candidatus Methanoculleus thermohydrogenotrophicum]
MGYSQDACHGASPASSPDPRPAVAVRTPEMCREFFEGEALRPAGRADGAVLCL